MEREEWERLRHDSESEPGEIEGEIFRFDLWELLTLLFWSAWEDFRNWFQARWK
jgi:hypothetical protein